MLALLLFGLGLALLVAGAELLVRGASGLGSSLGIGPLVIGLTVVAWGTSAPELAVNIQSAVQGAPQVALGTVVGSNIFNILVVLGLSALVAPLAVARQVVRRDVPVMIAVSLLLLLLALDGEISRVDGLILLAGMAGYTGWSIKQSRRVAEPASGTAGQPDPLSTWSRRQAPLNILSIAAGLGVLALGARWLVDGSVAMAEALGVSRLVIGVTIVAAGTSLPEAATSVVAALRGERDLAVGNAVGSNIFNILGALGVTSVVAPATIPVPPAALHLDIPVLIAVALACLPISFTGYRITRWEGSLFLAYYLAFVAYVVLDALQHEAMPGYVAFVKYFAVPATVVTLLVTTVRAHRERQHGNGS
ncbi:MAG: calcium/sodium antiporter [Gemmatimonadetes bacterium]|nr:calcium/sodium antiporter [Gemmatimonadota bacterium]NIO31940.1 calcium/sodium antiporter [Gemmatimonadota bacterium]